MPTQRNFLMDLWMALEGRNPRGSNCVLIIVNIGIMRSGFRKMAHRNLAIVCYSGFLELFTTFTKESVMKLSAITATIILVLSSAASAVPLGYWQFDDGSNGATATTLVTEVNAATLNGTASGNAGGPAPTFSFNVPGDIIRDGVGGPIINFDNKLSLNFQNTGAGGGVASPSSTVGGVVTVNDPGGAGSLLKPASFTVEAFVQVQDEVDFSTFIAKTRVDAGGSTWLLDNNSTDRLRVRIDSQPLGAGSGAGFNQSIASANPNLRDAQWHHIAMTYNETNRQVLLFVDYLQVASGTATNALVYDNNPLRIGDLGGGRAFDGFIDEVRLSNTVLTASQFLRAEPRVPEPASVMLLAMAGGALLRRRRGGCVDAQARLC